MSARIKPGTEVTWTSQSAGTTKTKTGTVVAFIPAGVTVPYTDRWGGLGRLWHKHPLAGDATTCKTGSRYSQNDRYLIRVQQGSRSVALYAPAASTIEEQNRADGEAPVSYRVACR